MKLKIKQSGFAEAKTLVLTEDLLTYRQSSALSAPKKKFNFNQIDYILSSAQSLAFGVGKDVFSIRMDPSNSQHKELRDTLVRKVKETLKT